MKGSWNILAWNGDSVVILFSDGEIELVSIDGRSGSDFVEEYIGRMSVHHDGHIRAVDGILQQMLGSKYNVVRTFRRIYQAHLAIVSMGCAFGPMADQPHYDGEGGFQFGYSPCPVRSVCPFNGYSTHRNKDGCYGCNPIYETGLSSRQTEVTDMLVNSPFSLAEIADRLCLDEGRVRNIASEVYAHLGVKNRQELVYLLKGKRIL